MDRFYVMPTPQELAEHIVTAMHWTLDNQTACPARAVIIYAWNEHDEGDVLLCPTLNENGSANTARLDAISAMKRAYPPHGEHGKLPGGASPIRHQRPPADRPR